MLEYATGANNSALTMQDSGVTSLPPEWRPPYNDDNVKVGEIEPRFDPRETQLVICLTAMRQAGATPIGTCTMYEIDIPSTFEVYPADYDFTAYEARTGNALTSFSIRGDQTAEQSCPGASNLVGNERFGQAIQPDTFAAHVQDLITRTA
ncbi:hypothetical protein [Saccharopolyspora sp. NPDC002686]|uniref:hypothetical protein n=1 Tax=Saccharopolyspora sp. NPDC002686 TaxID=3154541 RepID=UPI00331A0382